MLRKELDCRCEPARNLTVTASIPDGRLQAIGASPISTTMKDPRHRHRPRNWSKSEVSVSCRPALAVPPAGRPRTSDCPGYNVGRGQPPAAAPLAAGGIASCEGNERFGAVYPGAFPSTAFDGEVFASTASFSSRTALSSNSFAYRTSISLSETWSTSPDRRLARRARSLGNRPASVAFPWTGPHTDNVAGRRPLRFAAAARKISSALWCVRQAETSRRRESRDLPMPVLKHQMSHVSRRPYSTAAPARERAEPQDSESPGADAQ